MGPVTTRQFGISTHLYHSARLNREHLAEIRAHGFEAVEVFATRTHFDYHAVDAIVGLRRSLEDAGLRLHSIHAPITESLVGERWGPPLTLASTDPDARRHAVHETVAAINVARHLPFELLVVHLGLPRTQQPTAADNNREAARQSVDELQRAAAPLGVRLALEVLPNDLSQAGVLVPFIEDLLEESGAGICLDFGHAHMDGDVVDAVETVAEHLIATHVHDNDGRADTHLVPFDGSIDWAAALTAVQKVGYDGTLLLELAAHGSATETLRRARAARVRMETLLAG
jgi:sugar phosphate isomerase/epimerase